MNVKLKQINAQDCIPLRQLVLRNKQPIKTCIFSGDESKSTLHFGAFFDTHLVGIVSFMKQSNSKFNFTRQYQLRGMAIHPNFQGKGIGFKLLQFSLKKLSHLKSNICWCNAREKAVSFYQKQGFKVYGSKYEIPTVGTHYLMAKEINNQLKK